MPQRSPKVLLASPSVSAAHVDSGLFWLRALSECGIAVLLWDYRLTDEPPTGYKEVDVTIVLKGEGIVPNELASPRVCVWPDTFGRDPKAEEKLGQYDVAYTGAFDHPKGVQFLPLGFDSALHVPMNIPRQPFVVFVGTGTDRKEAFLDVIKPDAIFGNGWPLQGVHPVYGGELVQVLSTCQMAVNVHRIAMGVTRRLFEMIACAPTITDLVPGVEEVLGPVAQEIGFHTPQEGAELKSYFLANPDFLSSAWHRARATIQPYTYQAAVQRVMHDTRG